MARIRTRTRAPPDRIEGIEKGGHKRPGPEHVWSCRCVFRRDLEHEQTGQDGEELVGMAAVVGVGAGTGVVGVGVGGEKACCDGADGTASLFCFLLIG